MEVLEKDQVLLSNSEVMAMLKKSLEERKEKETRQKRKKYNHRDWIEEHVFEYLQKSPCAMLDVSTQNDFKSILTSSKKQSSADGESKKMTGFGLTEAEAVQVLNFMPKEKVEIHLMIEELHARMPEARQEELLEFIQNHTDVKKMIWKSQGKKITKGKLFHCVQKLYPFPLLFN